MNNKHLYGHLRKNLKKKLQQPVRRKENQSIQDERVLVSRSYKHVYYVADFPDP